MILWGLSPCVVCHIHPAVAAAVISYSHYIVKSIRDLLFLCGLRRQPAHELNPELIIEFLRWSRYSTYSTYSKMVGCW